MKLKPSLKFTAFILSIAWAGPVAYQIFHQNVEFEKTKAVSSQICRFVSPNLSMGSIRSVTDYLYSQLEPLAQGRQALFDLRVGSISYGNWTEAGALNRFTEIPCKILGRSDIKLSFYYYKNAFFSQSFFKAYPISIAAAFLIFVLLRLWFKQKMSAETGELALEVAHDLKSPLAVLNSVFSQLKNVELREKKLILDSVFQIQNTADRLLVRGKNRNNLYQRKTQKSELRFDPTSVLEIINEVCAQKKVEIRQRNVNIEVQTDLDLLGQEKLSGDPLIFKNILSNVINNAIEAIESSGFVLIRGRIEDSCLRLEVKDNGTGIPKHLVSRLGREKVHSKKDQGSGFGLYYARKHIKKWGGSLSIFSQEGKGSQVLLEIPIQELSWIQNHIDAVLIDDNKTLREGWEYSAETSQRKILAFSSVKEFNDNLLNIPKDTPIFVDGHLGNNKNGITESKKIFDRGFEKIYLTTGDKLDQDSIPYWIKASVGKDPPWTTSIRG